MVAFDFIKALFLFLAGILLHSRVSILFPGGVVSRLHDKGVE
jgi:hypothetical protein